MMYIVDRTFASLTCQTMPFIRGYPLQRYQADLETDEGLLSKLPYNWAGVDAPAHTSLVMKN